MGAGNMAACSLLEAGQKDPNQSVPQISAWLVSYENNQAWDAICKMAAVGRFSGKPNILKNFPQIR